MVKKIEINAMEMSRSVTEALNTLRTNLFYMDNVRVIAVSSSLPGEGKSVLSFALARSFAAMGKRTLFIDCDMRKSRMRSYYNVKSEEQLTGLSEFLTGQTNELIYATNIENLSVILSGKYPPDPSGMLSSKYFEKLMEKLIETYSYIIIDILFIIIKLFCGGKCCLYLGRMMSIVINYLHTVFGRAYVIESAVCAAVLLQSLLYDRNVHAKI